MFVSIVSSVLHLVDDSQSILCSTVVECALAQIDYKHYLKSSVYIQLGLINIFFIFFSALVSRNHENTKDFSALLPYLCV